MGKPGGKRKNAAGLVNQKKSEENNIDNDTAAFIKTAQELKEEGNKEFLKKNYEGAMEMYAKSLKLLPPGHMDLVFLHTNRAYCLMQMEPVENERVVDECTMALDVDPHNKKGLLRRAKAYEALGKIELALKDVEAVLQTGPNDKKALGVANRLRVILVEQTEDFPQQTRSLKLIYHDDIRLAQIPANCRLAQLREIVRERYPSSRAVLIKYKDLEDDLVTITSTEELRLAQRCVNPDESLRLYVVEVDPKHEPCFEDANSCKQNQKIVENGDKGRNEVEMDSWVYEFAELFKTHLGIDPHAHMDLQEVGMEFCLKALEDTATSEDAQRLFQMAENKFQEIAAVALFNWGNVHMCAATKKISLKEDSSKEELISQLQAAYVWAQGEYSKAGERYEEALRIKPDFYEGFLALGQQQFESAKLGWSLAVASNIDLDTWDHSETLKLFIAADENMKMGTEIWEMLEEKRLNESMTRFAKKEKFGHNTRELANGYDEELSADELAEHVTAMRSQINLFWGNMLFEHSHIEFKLGLPMWKEHLDAALEKFKLAGASPKEVAIVLKNHSSNASTQEGLGFKIDEIIQAWNEMCEAKRLANKCSSFRLEPLFKRKVAKLHQILEHTYNVCGIDLG